jgi:RsiW-degrading membrane proteinase PrsW (M82 family)
MEGAAFCGECGKLVPLGIWSKSLDKDAVPEGGSRLAESVSKPISAASFIGLDYERENGKEEVYAVAYINGGFSLAGAKSETEEVIDAKYPAADLEPIFSESFDGSDEPEKEGLAGEKPLLTAGVAKEPGEGSLEAFADLAPEALLTPAGIGGTDSFREKKASEVATKSSSKKKAPFLHEIILGDIESTLNAMTGNATSGRSLVKGMFSDILRMPGRQAAFDSFDRNRPWAKPWIFFQAFLALISSFAVIFGLEAIILSKYYEPGFNHGSGYSNAMLLLPGVILIGSFLTPICASIFFLEVNKPKNIGMFQAAGVFASGAGLYCLCAFLSSLVYGGSYQSAFPAVASAIFREASKFAAIFALAKKLNAKWILNGIAIGAITGSGFAALDTAGKAMIGFWTDGGFEALLRCGLFSFGSHAAWGAICGGAIMLGLRGRKIKIENALSWRFFRLALVAAALEAVWSLAPIFIQSAAGLWFFAAFISFIGWVFVWRLLNAGFKEFKSFKAREQAIRD